MDLILVHVFVTELFVYGYLGDVTPESGCEHCGCCMNGSDGPPCGRNDTIDYDDYCYHGCKPGFWGNRCYHRCPPTCTACARNYIADGLLPCTICPDGKYSGSDGDCSLDCPSTCKNCLSSEYCLDCNEPYLNTNTITNCSMVCPLNCVCELSGQCTSCKPGYFDVNNECRQMCSKNCEDCIAANNCTVCIDGTYGVVCEHNCSSSCLNNTCSKHDGVCECIHTDDDQHCLHSRSRSVGTNCVEMFGAVFGGTLATCMVILVIASASIVLMEILCKIRKTKQDVDVRPLVIGRSTPDTYAHLVFSINNQVYDDLEIVEPTYQSIDGTI